MISALRLIRNFDNWLTCLTFSAVSALVAICPVQAQTLPDVQVIDQFGHKLRFYHDLVQGRVVAVDFLFTSCGTVCPMLGATFAKVATQLGERAGNDISLISISIDPENDTPEQLREFAHKFGDKRGWTLVTGEKRNIEELQRAFNEYTPDKLAHSPDVLIGRGDGHWVRANGIGSPDKIVKLLLDMAGTAPRASAAR